MAKVIGQDTTARLNRAIAVPVQLTCADGRVFSLVKWNPSVSKDHAVSIDATFLVQLPDDVDNGDGES